tara:strand:+ start:70 stop:810 length:741 start_codon:yes stop_codon:yes gene_type:complete
MSTNTRRTRPGLYVSTEKLEKRLDKYNRRINQLKTIQLQRQTELNLIMNQPEAWIRSQGWGKHTSAADKQEALEKRKEHLSNKNTRLDILLMKAEGGTITQGMFDYGENKNLFGKKGENFIERFNLVKPDGTAYVVGDKYIPLDTDRVNLIENIEEILEDRALTSEIGFNKEEADKNFPTVTITDPQNKYKTIEIDKEDYYSGTDFRDEQSVIDSSYIKLLEQQKIKKENNESKIDLTKELTIEDF